MTGAIGVAIGSEVEHACTLQICVVGPLHGFPPRTGAGFVHVLDCVPSPHALLHVDQLDQPPFTAEVQSIAVMLCSLDEMVLTPTTVLSIR